MKKIKAIVCRVGKKAVVEEVVDELDVWRALVKGDEEQASIQMIHVHDGVYVVCNDNGRLGNGKGETICKFNRKLPSKGRELPFEGIQVLYICVDPEKVAKPGEWGYFDMFGDFALVRIDRDGEFSSVLKEDEVKWTLLLDTQIATSKVQEYLNLQISIMSGLHTTPKEVETALNDLDHIWSKMTLEEKEEANNLERRI